jgi:CheY-like chemotaxis protein
MEKLLWVDDESELTSLVAPKLDRLGYEVKTYDRYRGAIEVAREFRPHYAIVDVMLGDGGGYQISRALRGDRRLCVTPVLFLSSLSDEQEISHALEQGGDFYLTKPFNFEQLKEKLAKLHALRQEIITPCLDTRLPSVAAMKREIDRRLINHQPAGLCCIQAVGMHRFGERKGLGEEKAACMVVAKCMRDALRETQVEDGYLARMDNEYYLALMPIDRCRAFADHAIADFAEQSRSLYTEVEWLREDLLNSGNSQTGLDSIKMCLRISVVHTKDRQFANASAMLEALSDTHSVLGRSRGSAVFIDRKTDHRGVLPFEIPPAR